MTTPVAVTEGTYPALYLSADASAVRGRRAFLAATAMRLAGLSVAAAAGIFSVTMGPVDAFGLVALVAFVVAIGAEVYLLSQQPDRLWYEGRAAAESAKTITWRYLVGGRPFDRVLPDPEADAALLARVAEVTHDLATLDIVPVASADRQITESMRHIRALDLAARKKVYETYRIAEQWQWYAQNAALNARRARWWSVSLLVIEGLGIFVAAAKAFQLVNVDLLGILGSVGAASLGWTQAKQHQRVARSYGVAAQELAAIRSLMAHAMDEAAWSRFVEDAENAVSREHTLWRASRGARVSV